MEKDNKTLQLFLTFMKIGAFTFGGGYAMIPFIQREVVDNRRWLSQEDILDIVAIAESTPGPIAINAATFVGYKVKGVKGAIVSTLGVVLPSFAIIVLIATLFNRFMDNRIVKNAFWGVRIAVLALMIKAFITMFKQCPRNIVVYLIAIASLAAVVFLDINVLLIIMLAAIIGLVYNAVTKWSNK